jgi:hypothetical protein
MREFLKPLIVNIETSQYERRRKKRLFLNYPVEISGIDCEGREFIERTKTEDISDSGCCVRTSVAVEKGSVLTVRLISPPAVLDSEEQVKQYEIIWSAQDDRGWTLGLKNLHSENPWKVRFPESS